MKSVAVYWLTTVKIGGAAFTPSRLNPSPTDSLCAKIDVVSAGKKIDISSLLLRLSSPWALEVTAGLCSPLLLFYAADCDTFHLPKIYPFSNTSELYAIALSPRAMECNITLFIYIYIYICVLWQTPSLDFFGCSSSVVRTTTRTGTSAILTSRRPSTRRTSGGCSTTARISSSGCTWDSTSSSDVTQLPLRAHPPAEQLPLSGDPRLCNAKTVLYICTHLHSCSCRQHLWIFANAVTSCLLSP